MIEAFLHHMCFDKVFGAPVLVFRLRLFFFWLWLRLCCPFWLPLGGHADAWWLMMFSDPDVHAHKEQLGEQKRGSSVPRKISEDSRSLSTMFRKFD